MSEARVIRKPLLHTAGLCPFRLSRLGGKKQKIELELERKANTSTLEVFSILLVSRHTWREGDGPFMAGQKFEEEKSVRWKINEGANNTWATKLLPQFHRNHQQNIRGGLNMNRITGIHQRYCVAVSSA